MKTIENYNAFEHKHREFFGTSKQAATRRKTRRLF